MAYKQLHFPLKQTLFISNSLGNQTLFLVNIYLAKQKYCVISFHPSGVYQMPHNQHGIRHVMWFKDLPFASLHVPHSCFKYAMHHNIAKWVIIFQRESCHPQLIIFVASASSSCQFSHSRACENQPTYWSKYLNTHKRLYDYVEFRSSNVVCITTKGD